MLRSIHLFYVHSYPYQDFCPLIYKQAMRLKIFKLKDNFFTVKAVFRCISSDIIKYTKTIFFILLQNNYFMYVFRHKNVYVVLRVFGELTIYFSCPKSSIV